MSKVRILVGTRKGAFIITSDGKRNSWDVSGPHFAGWEVYHLKASPADPDRIYASQSSSWFGQIIQRSEDGGKSWFQPGLKPGEPTKTPDGSPVTESNKFAYDTSPASGKPLSTHQWYDGTQHPWEFKRVWHLEPSPADPDTVFAGVETPPYSARPTARPVGMNSRGCAATALDPNGSRAPAACAFTPSSSIRRIPCGCSLPSPRRAPSVRMTAAKRGSPSTAA